MESAFSRREELSCKVDVAAEFVSWLLARASSRQDLLGNRRDLTVIRIDKHVLDGILVHERGKLDSAPQHGLGAEARLAPTYAVGQGFGPGPQAHHVNVRVGNGSLDAGADRPVTTPRPRARVGVRQLP